MCSVISATKLISAKKSSKEILPLFSSKVFVIDLNSSKLAILPSASIVFSLSNSFLIPDFSSTASTNSVKVDVFDISTNSSIIFLNSNSLPLSIESNKLLFNLNAFSFKSLIVFVPIPLFWSINNSN